MPGDDLVLEMARAGDLGNAEGKGKIRAKENVGVQKESREPAYEVSLHNFNV